MSKALRLMTIRQIIPWCVYFLVYLNVLHSFKGQPSEVQTIGGHDDFHTAQVIEAIELVQQLHPIVKSGIQGKL